MTNCTVDATTSLPEHEDNAASIPILKSHVSVSQRYVSPKKPVGLHLAKKKKHFLSNYKQDLLHIFSYLKYDELLQCRLVCSHWYQIIKHETRLIDRFRYGLTFDSGSVISMAEPPFSIVCESKIKLKRITIKEDFLERGNSVAVVEANRSKLAELSNMLVESKSTGSITEMTVHAKDNEQRTNALLFQMISQMTKLRILRLTLTAFVGSVEALTSTPNALVPYRSLEHIQIMHSDCKRLILEDFTRLLRIFPNIKRIDVTTYDAMLLGADILRRYARLFKSIEKLESYTVIEVTDIEHLSLQHVAFECLADDFDDVVLLYEIHRKIETMDVKLLNGTRVFFTQPLEKLTGLNVAVKKTRASDEEDEHTKLGNILLMTPNLRKLSVRCKGNHQFGHQVVDMKSLKNVTMTRFCLDCEKCFATALKSMAQITTLKLLRHAEITLKQLTLLSTHLVHLHSLELMFEDVSFISRSPLVSRIPHTSPPPPAKTLFCKPKTASHPFFRASNWRTVLPVGQQCRN